LDGKVGYGKTDEEVRRTEKMKIPFNAVFQVYRKEHWYGG